jgi:hypothetical protein
VSTTTLCQLLKAAATFTTGQPAGPLRQQALKQLAPLLPLLVAVADCLAAAGHQWHKRAAKVPGMRAFLLRAVPCYVACSEEPYENWGQDLSCCLYLTERLCTRRVLVLRLEELQAMRLEGLLLLDVLPGGKGLPGEDKVVLAVAFGLLLVQQLPELHAEAGALRVAALVGPPLVKQLQVGQRWAWGVIGVAGGLRRGMCC